MDPSSAALSRASSVTHPEAPLPSRVVVALAVSIGLFSQVAQIVMFREMLAACRGTEVFLGMVLAAGLVWTALGSVAAGLYARREGRRLGARWPARAWASAAALFTLNGLLLIGQIAIARHRSPACGGAAELTFAEAAATAVLATGPVAFACGLELVLAFQAVRPQDFARLYQADAWGAVAGGLLFTFALVGLADPVTLGPALTAGLCLLVLAAGARRWALTGIVLGLGAAVTVAVTGLDAHLHAQRWRALLPGFTLCATQDSRYGQLAALKHPSEEQYSLYVDGGLVESLPPPAAPMTDERNQARFALAQHPAPKQVLLVGRTLGRLPAALLECGVAHLDALELDPSLLALARRYLQVGGTDEPRLHRHFADVRRFIKGQRARLYDVIILNLPDPLSAFVNRLYTAEFFEQAREAMAPQGVLITSVSAAANYAGESVGQLSASVLKTLQSAFPEVLVAPGESHTFIAATRPGLVSLDPAALGRRLAERGAPDPAMPLEDRRAYCSALFENLIITSQVDSLRKTLDAIPAPVNTDARPITYPLALLVWNQIVSADTEAREPGLRSGTNVLFKAALRFRFAHGLVLPVAILAPGVVTAALAGNRRRSAAYGALVVAAATGFFGMAAEIVLIYSFQSVYGYAYAEVGALVAAFMVGLALGAGAGGRWADRRRALPAIMGAMVAYCLLLPAVLKALGSSAWLYPVFGLLAALAGLLDGATFPPLVQVLRRQGFERPAGWVYAADLAGSGLGALVTGALLVPVIGDSAAMLLVAVTLAAALVALALGTLGPRAASNTTG